MIGYEVDIKRETFIGNVRIVDKVITCKSKYSKSTNEGLAEASFEVYVGIPISPQEGDPIIIQFLPTCITAITKVAE